MCVFWFRVEITPMFTSEFDRTVRRSLKCDTLAPPVLANGRIISGGGVTSSEHQQHTPKTKHDKHVIQSSKTFGMLQPKNI